MGTVETFDHTADVGLRVRAETLDDLFRTAAAGMFGYIVVNLDEVRVLETEEISLSAGEPADLLVSWLNELIFRSETRHWLYVRYDVNIAEDGLRLTGQIAGEAMDRDRHVLDHEVKSVTHHGLTLNQDAEGWVAELILDI